MNSISGRIFIVHREKVIQVLKLSEMQKNTSKIGTNNKKSILEQKKWETKFQTLEISSVPNEEHNQSLERSERNFSVYEKINFPLEIVKW